MVNAKHALVAFGGNLPLNERTTAELIGAAVASIEQAGLRLISLSRLYRTPCFPVGAGPDYVNAAACFALPLGFEPEQVLTILHQVEAELGRERKARWAGRTLDADLLAVDDLIRPDPAVQTTWRNLSLEKQMQQAPSELILPHPRLQDRAFVLIPLLDVAPNWVHPLLGETVEQMLSHLSSEDREGVREFQ